MGPLFCGKNLSLRGSGLNEKGDTRDGAGFLLAEAKDILNRGRAEVKSDMVLELLRTKQPLDFTAKVSKFSVERIAEIGRMNGIPV